MSIDLAAGFQALDGQETEIDETQDTVETEDLELEADSQEYDDGMDASEEEVGEDFAIRVPYETMDGGTQEIDLNTEALPKVVTKAMAFDQLYHEAVNWKSRAEQNDALVRAVAADSFLSTVFTLRAQGRSEADVLRYIASLYPENGEPAEEVYDEFGDLDPAVAKVLSQTNKKFEETQRELQTIKDKEAYQGTVQHNNTVFAEAVKSAGVEFTGSQQELQKLVSAAQELFPGADISQMRFTPRQAAAIVKEADLPRRTSPGATAKQKVAQVRKNASAPKIINGLKPAGQRQRKNVDSDEPAGYSKRLENYAKLGF
jgi:hypothetical protein